MKSVNIRIKKKQKTIKIQKLYKQIMIDCSEVVNSRFVINRFISFIDMTHFQNQSLSQV